MVTYIDEFKPETNLRKRIKAYQRRIAHIQEYLSRLPEEWGRFQSEFNQEVNGIFRDLMLFEKENVAKGSEDRAYKLKMFFIKHFRELFVKGKCLQKSLNKPYGYAGDFEIIDDIYQNQPDTVGFDRLYDNYFQMSAICHAVRNRKEDFKRFALRAMRDNPKKNFKILVLASGPCRDVYELLSGPLHDRRDVIFHCFDADPNSMEYGKTLLGNDMRVTFFKQNAVRLALRKDITKNMEGGYDFIFSTGLFDYLDEKISVRLIHNLRELLSARGVVAISDVRDRFSNPSIYFMEWVADWNLVYRDDDDFRKIFVEAGFSRDEYKIGFEQQGILQYIYATKRA